MRFRALLPLLLATVAPGAALAAGGPPSEARPTLRRPVTADDTGPLLGRRDLWFALGSAAAVAVAFSSDEHVRREATGSTNRGLDELAKHAERFGNPRYIGPPLLLVEGASHLFRAPGLRAANRRVVGAILVTGLATQALKLSTGRARPEDSGGDPYRFRPFSGDDAFPSGHTTVAFSAAAAIDHETSAPWVPFVVYPTAGLVAWSRVMVDRHWASDAVAGAALGAWMGHKVSRLERRSGLDPRRWFGAAVDPWVAPARGGLVVGANARF